jgi:NACHT domain
MNSSTRNRKSKPTTLFISAVTSEFGALRNALAFGLEPYGCEVFEQARFKSGGEPLLQVLEKHVAGCDALLWVSGDAPGWIAATPHGKTLPLLSYTQWELYFALGYRLADFDGYISEWPEPSATPKPIYALAPESRFPSPSAESFSPDWLRQALPEELPLLEDQQRRLRQRMNSFIIQGIPKSTDLFNIFRRVVTELRQKNVLSPAQVEAGLQMQQRLEVVRRVLSAPRKAPTEPSEAQSEAQVAALRADRQQLALFSEMKPRTELEYQLVRAAYWCQIDIERDVRFTPLALVRDVPSKQGQVERVVEEIFHPLEAWKHHENAFGVQILGAPGAGKSTLLQRLQLDMAEAALQPQQTSDQSIAPKALTFLVRLREFPRNTDDFRNCFTVDAKVTMNGKASCIDAWLDALWQEEFEEMPLRSDLNQPLWILIDGINELQSYRNDDGNNAYGAWNAWLKSRTSSEKRCFITCRSADIGVLEAARVHFPVLTVKELDNEKVKAFIEAYAAPNLAEKIWSELKEQPRLIEAFSLPFWLMKLVEVAKFRFEENANPDSTQQVNLIPANRAEMLTEFVLNALKEEKAQKNDRLKPPLFTAQDKAFDQKLARNHRDVWLKAYGLPADQHTALDAGQHGLFFTALADLALSLQSIGNSRENPEQATLVDVKTVLQKFISSDKGEGSTSLDKLCEPFIELAVGLKLLVGVGKDDRYEFAHALMREYFAARAICSIPQAELQLKINELGVQELDVPAFDASLKALKHGDYLPAASANLWVETLLLAAQLHRKPLSLVQAVSHADNEPLATRSKRCVRFCMADYKIRNAMCACALQRVWP